MSSQEEMRLVAQVVNKFSQPIRDMQRSLRTIGEHGKAVHTEGARYAKAHKDSFEALRKTARETSDHFKNIFNPAMVGMGISAISVGGAIAGLAKGIKDLGAFGRDMSFASKETGLALNRLNAYIEAGSRVNIPTEAMIQGLTQVNEKLSQFEKRRDSALATFFAANRDKSVIANLEDSLRAAAGDREKQNKLIIDTYDKLKEADQHLLEEQFGEQNFRRLKSTDVNESQKKLHQFTDDETAALIRQQKAFDDTATAAKKFAQELELTFSPGMTRLSHEATELLHGDWSKLWHDTEVDAEVWAKRFEGIFGKVGDSLSEKFKTWRDEINALIKDFEGVGVKALPNPNPKILGPGDPGYDDAETVEEMAKKRAESLKKSGDEATAAGFKNIRGSASDIRGMPGSQTPGAEIRQEAIINRATMRGTAEGSRIGVLAAFHEWEDEKRRGAGIQTAAYNTGGTGPGGLGGGYGGLGGGAGGGLGGGAPGGPSGGGSMPAALSAAAAIRRKLFGHPGKGGAGSILGEIDKAAGGDTRVANAMKAIFSGESLHNKGYDLGDYVGGKPTSFGPFQAHFARDHKAIGDQMLAAGIDARDPKTIPAQAKWIADYLKAHPHMNIGKTWMGYDKGARDIAASHGRFGGGGYEGAGDGRTAEQHQALIDAAKKVNPFTLGVPPGHAAAPLASERGKTSEVMPNIPLSGGAAGRKDSLSGMTADFRSRLGAMFRDAPPGSSVFSGYRSPELQAQLFAHSDRSGRMVARPGHSHHGMGDAADLRGNLPWFHKHADKYGLRFPMGYEPWHIQSDPKTKVPALSEHHHELAKKAKTQYDAGLHDIKGKLNDMRRDPEFDKFINNPHVISYARQSILRGVHLRDVMSKDTREKDINVAASIYHRSHAEFVSSQKSLHERLLRERQGEANTGAGAMSPLHPGKHHRGEQDPAWAPLNRHHAEHGRDPDMNYWWNLGRNRQHMQRADLLGNARKAGLLEQPAHKVTGSASLSVDFKNMPRGVKTKTKIDGMFSQIRVARGRAMPLANQEG